MKKQLSTSINSKAWALRGGSLAAIQTSLHLTNQLDLVIGSQLPSVVSKMKRGAPGRTWALADKWWWSVEMGNVGLLRFMRIIGAPFGPSVFDQEMLKVAYRTPDRVKSKTIQVVLETCSEGSNRLQLGTPSSERTQSGMEDRFLPANTMESNSWGCVNSCIFGVWHIKIVK